MYNSFDISRVYLNTYFTPTDDLTFRFTPELYRANGSGTADKTGASTGFGSNLDGDLNVRLKYAYVQYTGLTDGIPQLKGGNVTFGAQPNPLLGWEEDFTQYRYVYLSPWNYVGLSSSQVGLAFQRSDQAVWRREDLPGLWPGRLQQRQLQRPGADRHQAGDGDV